MTLGREIAAAARLDLGEVLRSRWLLFSTVIYTVLAAALVIAGMRESVVLGFTGMSRVQLSFTHVLLVVLPLLALAATTQVVNRARDDGTIELLFSQPISRTAYLAALTITRYLVLVVPFLALMLLMGVIGAVAFGDAIPWAMTLRSSAIGAALLWSFVGIGVLVSVAIRHQSRAVVWGLAIWALAVALLDLALIGVLLQWRVDARALFAVASLNPVQAARIGLLSGLDPDLGTLGPVGFFLANRVGAGLLLALGIAWPLVTGTGAWLLALRSFRRGDLV
jgi:ABC-2 type transport system permease protein